MRTEGYLGLDVGGTGAKAGVFNRNGEPLALAHRSYATKISEDGRAELPVEEIDEAAREVVQEVAGRSGARLLGMSVSSQGQTFVTLDHSDQPLHGAIAWFDSRATEEAKLIRDQLDENDLRHLDLTPIASAAKILWLKRNHPGTMDRAARFLLLPDYFTYRLTGQAVYDPTMAGTTGLYSQLEHRYNAAALQAAGVSPEQLSRVAPAGTPVGRVTTEVGRRWGLGPDTLVAVGTNDQLAGALGAGNVRPGIVSETTGTCLALITLADSLLPEIPPGLFQGPFPVPGTSFVLAYAKTAGLLLEWFRRHLGAGATLADLDAGAASISPGSSGLSVLPHFDGVISPRPNPAARGAFVNLSLQHTRLHMYRAILESVAFSLRENLELLAAAGFTPGVLRAIGGGAASDLWLQIKSDVTGHEIERPVVTEAAVLGAAVLAVTSTGSFGSIREASEALYRRQKVFYPGAVEHRCYEESYRRYLDYQRILYP